MDQINDHTPLPIKVNVDFMGSCELRSTGNKKLDSSDYDTYAFIKTACNNFYKMKDGIRDLKNWCDCLVGEIDYKNVHYDSKTVCELVASIKEAKQLLKEKVSNEPGGIEDEKNW